MGDRVEGNSRCWRFGTSRLKPWLAGCVVLLWFSAGSATPAVAASPPVAIVVTNSNYDFTFLNIPAAANDGTEFVKRLTVAGFDPARIVRISDPSAADFKTLLATARASYADASAVIFYYSGHGVLVESIARLVPRDFSFADLQSTINPRSLTDQTVAVADIIGVWKGSTTPALFIFDACRDDGGNGQGASFFSKLSATELTRSANQPQGAAQAPVDIKQGTFDNQGNDPTVRVGRDEDLHRDNAVVLLGAVRTTSGPGISYAVPGEANSEFTAALVSQMDLGPDRGVSEIFPLARKLVWEHTQTYKPPQQPHSIDYLPPNYSLKGYARPETPAPIAVAPPAPIAVAPPAPIAVAPPTPIAVAPPTPIAPVTVAKARDYVNSITTTQQESGRTNQTKIFSAPFDLSGVSLPKLAMYVQTTNQGDRAVLGGLAAAPPPPPPPPVTAAAAPAPPAGPQVKLTARLWKPEDRRVYGVGGTLPAKTLPSRDTTVTALRDGGMEYRQKIVADEGYRIMDVQTRSTSAVGLLDYRAERRTDASGVLEQDKIWRLRTNTAGQPSSRFTAELTVIERATMASGVLLLTDLFPLVANQHITPLRVPPEELSNFDVLQVQSSEGAVLAELKVGERKPVAGTNLSVELFYLNNKLTLQTAVVR